MRLHSDGLSLVVLKRCDIHNTDHNVWVFKRWSYNMPLCAVAAQHVLSMTITITLEQRGKPDSWIAGKSKKELPTEIGSHTFLGS